jgi:hypothetical protein
LPRITEEKTAWNPDLLIYVDKPTPNQKPSLDLSQT